jgi:hypothetical protein
VGSRPQYFLAARTPIAVPFQKQFALVAPFVAITIIAAVLLPFSFVGKANVPARHIPRLLGEYSSFLYSKKKKIGYCFKEIMNTVYDSDTDHYLGSIIV